MKFILKISLFVLSLFVIFGFLTNVSASEATINSNDDGGIRNIIENTQHNKIYLEEGHYNGIENTGLIVDRDIEIIGKNRNVVIDGENQRNIFTLKDGSKLILINITIKNSLNSAIYSQGDYKVGSTKVSLIDCKFYNNNGKNSGGAIYINNNGEISVSNCVFENNKGVNGGVFTLNGPVSFKVKNSSFKNNAATKGGVLFDTSQKLIEFDNSVFTNNKANGDGGVIYSKNNIVVKNSRFTGNKANYGSTIYSTNKLKVSSSSFSNNKAKIGLKMSLVGNVIMWGTSGVRVTLISHNNVVSKGVNYPIFHSGSNGLVNINGKYISKINLLNKHNFKVNGVSGKTDTKGQAIIKFKTYPSYEWRNYRFTAIFGGNSFHEYTQTILNVKTKIIKTKCYNLNKKGHKYYVPYRKDQLQTFHFNTEKYFNKITTKKAGYNIYFLGGETVAPEYRKYLKGNSVCQVNHISIKKQLAKILRNKANKVSGLITPMKKAKAIYYWVRNNVGYLINADYDSVDVLKRTKTMKRYKNTNCAGHTNLLNALSRTAGIPAAYFYFKPVNAEYHVHSLIYLQVNGKWRSYKADAVGKSWPFGFTGWKIESDLNIWDFPAWY